MPVFAYRALTSELRPVHGTVAADSAQQARFELRAQGLQVEKLDEQQDRSSRSSVRPGLLRWKRIKPAAIAAVVRELATLLRVGVPLLHALDVLIEQHEQPVRASLLELRDRVASGNSLADSMGTQPQNYDELTLRMVEVGETAGNLDEVLGQLADFKSRSLELRDRVKTALLYPSIVFSAAVLVSIFLMTVVVPMLLENLLEAGRPLPAPTRVLKWMSDGLLEYGWLLVAGAAVTGVAVVTLARTDRGRWLIASSTLRLPLVGPMLQKQTLSRASMVLATLLRSGIELVEAMRVAGNTVRNAVLSRAFTDSRDAIAGGVDLGRALERCGVFPPVAIQVFAVGQQTGHLPEMLEQLANDYDRDVTTLSTRLAAALEPLLIIILSVFVGFILFATILPILEAGNVL